MSTAESPRRSLQDLGAADRLRLEEAHHRLQVAVQAYEPLMGNELPTDRDPEPKDLREMIRVRRQIDDAREELWRVREELLGWKRSGWDPPASILAEWMLEENVYDRQDGTLGQ